MDAKSNTEEAILKAAEDEFMANGFAGAKTVAIAERAGVTHAMLHYYFRSKRNLYEKVLNEKMELMIRSFGVFFERSDDDIVERIRHGIEYHFDFFKANPLLPFFMVNEVFSKNDVRIMDVMRAKVFNVYKKIQKEVDAAVAAGNIRPVSAFDLMLDIISLNVFAFVAKPFIKGFEGVIFNNEDEMYEARKRENVEVIMSRILVNKN